MTSLEIVAVVTLIFTLFLFAGAVYYFRRVITDASYYARLMDEAAQAVADHDLLTAQKRYLKVLNEISKIKSPPANLLNVKGQALFGMGNLQRSSNRLAEAFNWYREAMRLIQVPADVIEFVAMHYVNRKAMTPQAVDTYILFIASANGRRSTQALATHPVVTFLQNLCRVELVNDSTQLQATVTLIQRLLGVAPNLEWAHYALGIALQRLDRGAQSIVAFERAEQLNPGRATTPFQLGQLYLAQGQRNRAYDAFKRALRVASPNSLQPQVLSSLTKILLARIAENGLPTSDEQLAEASDLLQQACRSTTHQPAELWHALGQIEWQREQAEEARVAFEQAVAQEPQNQRYQLALADVLIKLNDTPAAIASLRQVIKIKPQHLPSQLQLAKLLLMNGQAAEAEAHYRKVLELEPSHKEARLAMGRLLYQLGRWAEAANELRQVPDLSEEDWYALARAFSRDGQPAEAIKVYKYNLKLDRSTPNRWFYLGCAFAQTTQWSQALHAFEQAEAAGFTIEAIKNINGNEGNQDKQTMPAGPIALYRGIVLTYLGQIEQAEAAYQRAAQEAPNDAQIPYAQGILALQRGNARSAWQAFSKSRTLNPKYAPPYFGRGLLYERARQWSQAIRQYAQGLNRQPNWLPAQARLAIVQAKAGYWSLALASLQRVSELGLHSDELIFYFGLAQAQQKQYEQALATWQPLYARHRNDKALANNLALIYYHLGEQSFEAQNYAEAVAYWQQATQMRPHLAELRTCLKEATLRLAATELAQSKNGTAPSTRQHLEEVLPWEPNNTRARYYLALVALKEGDMEEAIQHLSTLADTYPERDQIRYQLALALLSEGKTDAAKPLLQNLTPAPTLDTPGLQIAQANLALSEGHWGEALDLYVSLL